MPSSKVRYLLTFLYALFFSVSDCLPFGTAWHACTVAPLPTPLCEPETPHKNVLPLQENELRSFGCPVWVLSFAVYCNALWLRRLLLQQKLLTISSLRMPKWEFFVRREEKPTRCHWMLYCTHDTLNVFRVLLCPSSGARDYMCVIYRLWCAVLGCWLSGVRCRTAGWESRKRDAARRSRAASLFLDSQPAALYLAPDNQQPSTAHHRR